VLELRRSAMENMTVLMQRMREIAPYAGRTSGSVKEATASPSLAGVMAGGTVQMGQMSLTVQHKLLQ